MGRGCDDEFSVCSALSPHAQGLNTTPCCREEIQSTSSTRDLWATMSCTHPTQLIMYQFESLQLKRFPSTAVCNENQAVHLGVAGVARYLSLGASEGMVDRKEVIMM